jgi:hypothetical protein
MPRAPWLGDKEGDFGDANNDSRDMCNKRNGE